MTSKTDELSQWQILGPLALLATLALAHLSLDLLLVGVIGLYLSAKWHLKGFTYALFLLAVVGVSHHLIVQEHHLWQLGLEVSLGCALLITALSFEQNASEVSALTSQISALDTALHNFEEDLGKEKEEITTEKIALSEKAELLQKELEELQGEQSSLLTLNDVLRKTAAHHLEEKTAAEKQLQEVLQQGEEMRKELRRLSDESAFVKQNRELFEELNVARVEREQTQQINASLVRLHAKEASKAKKAEEQLLPLTEERNFLKERLALAELELQKASPATPEQRQVETLYRQLKKQFEEKSQILDQTRKELFQTDTALQTLKVEAEQKEHLFPQEMEKELERLETQLDAVQKENRELHEVISRLSEQKKGFFDF